MRSKILRILALGGALCLPAWVGAASGIATVENLQFEVINLAPGNGNTPSLSWNTAIAGADVAVAYGSSITYSASSGWNVSYLSSGADTVFNGTSFNSAASAAFVGAQASVASDGVSAKFQTHGTGSFDSASSFGYGEFTLSQMTGLRITGTLSVAIHGPAASTFTPPPGTPADFAALFAQSFAYAEVSLLPFSGDGGSSEFLSLSGENYIPSSDPNLSSASFGDSILLPFTLRLFNTTDTDMTGTFSERAITSGEQLITPITSPVPEPQTWVMLAAGMLLAGLRLTHTRRG